MSSGVKLGLGAEGVLITDATNDITTINGTLGHILVSNGLGVAPSFQPLANALDYIIVSTTSTPYVARTIDQIISIDSSGGPKVVHLPNAPSSGRWFVIKDEAGSCDTNNITITTVAGLVNIDSSTSFVMNSAYEAITMIFNGTKYIAV